MKKISIITPVYNEEANVPVFYEQVKKVISPLSAKYDFEIIFVNDGSKDKTAEIIKKLSVSDTKVKYLEFSRNFGKEIATTAGFNNAKGDCAILLDADLQHPIELIPKFIADWEQGSEVVVGIRKASQSDTFIKIWGSKLFYKIMSRISETEVAPNSTDFCLLDRKVLDAFNQCQEKTRITRGLLAWLGFKRSHIEFEAKPRVNGQASYSTLKLIKLALSSFVSMSLFPLKLAGYLGVFITTVSGVLGLFILIEKTVLGDPWNFTWLSVLVIAILFLVGIILSCLGLIALYIGSISLEVSNRPMYVIREEKL